MSRHFEQTLHEFGQRMGIDGLCLDEDGHCLLGFDAVPVHFQLLDDEGHVACYCPLGPLDAETQPCLAWELLHANFHFQQTGGASLSRDKGTGQCMLSRLLDGAHITTNALENHITQFVDTAEFWMRRLQDATSPAPSSVPDPVDPSPHGPLQQMV